MALREGKPGVSRAFSIRELSFPVEYRIHVELNGWLPWTRAADQAQFR